MHLEVGVVRGSLSTALAVTMITMPATRALWAQDRSQDAKSSAVPESAMPPAGMCRVWLRDVPERQQPAPTDCATAIRMMPRDAQVLFGSLKRAARVVSLEAGSAASPRGSQSSVPAFRGAGQTAVDIRPGTSAASNAQRGLVAVTAVVPGGSAAAKEIGRAHV